jgi:hypothetical protein
MASARVPVVLGLLASDVWLPALRLPDEAPIRGVVVDTQGSPIAGARLVVDYRYDLAAETDAEGRFELHGFGEDAEEAHISAALFQRTARRLAGERTALRWVLERATVLRGRALDEATGAPVAIVDAGLFRIDGSLDRTHFIACGGEWEDLGDGRFHVPYAGSGEYSLTVHADGYEAQELEVRLVAERPAPDVVVRLRRTCSADEDVHPRAIVRFLRAGEAIRGGQVRFHAVAQANAPNMALRRGCPVPQVISGELPVDGLGRCAFPAGWESSPFEVVTPDGFRSVHRFASELAPGGGVLDVELAEPGVVSGRVAGLPAAARGTAWVVAFGDNLVSAEIRLAPDRSFRLTLPPGKYGLRAGHDAFSARRTALSRCFDFGAFGRSISPWRGTVRVRVRSRVTRADVVVRWQ